MLQISNMQHYHNPNGRRPNEHPQDEPPTSPNQHMLPPLDSMVAGAPPYQQQSHNVPNSPSLRDRHFQTQSSRQESYGGPQMHGVAQFGGANPNSVSSESPPTQFRYSITTGPNPNPDARPAPRQQAMDGPRPPTNSDTSTRMAESSSRGAAVVRPSTSAPKSTWIKNLIGDHRKAALDTIDFELNVRQQPRAARACGYGDRDRRVLDPPPIVQLNVMGSGMTEDEKKTYLRYPTYVMSCSIYDETGTKDAAYIDNEYPSRRRMMGTLISSPFVGNDEHGIEGCFFCFPDISCRTPGAFRLQFTLMMLDPPRAATVRHFPTIAEVQTEVFNVYSAKEFPGMVASSELAKRLREQGCIISIKKGNDRARNARGRNAGSEDEEDNDNE